MQLRIDEAFARVPDAAVEADVVRRAMALRKQKRIGVVWAERGKYYVSESEYDPWGTRWPVSIAQLLEMVEAVERKPVESEGSASGCNSYANRTR